MMNKFELAKMLYAEGYEHREVRSIWAYAWNEQNVGRAGKKRRPWQSKALDKVGVNAAEIQFEPTDGGDLNSYS